MFLTAPITFSKDALTSSLSNNSARLAALARRGYSVCSSMVQLGVSHRTVKCLHDLAGCVRVVISWLSTDGIQFVANTGSLVAELPCAHAFSRTFWSIRADNKPRVP